MRTQSIKSLQDFVNYTHTHIKGNERSEAQSFLNAFFQAFGYDDAISAGAKFEQGVTKGSAKGNKGSADLVWADRVLIEMKSRGEDLQKHYPQLDRYWTRLAPKPKYSILCNFDEFWIYDFNNQVDTPVDQIKLDELVHQEGAFRFMRSATYAPIFRNNQVELTEKNAKRVGELYQALLERGRKQNFRDFDEDAIQRFILQCVLAMFAEDRGLLPKDMFISCVQDCKNQQNSSHDILGGLFEAMNRKGVTSGGRYKGVEYFNGGLFAKICPIELTSQEILMLENCALQRWDRVRPSIFGSIFESAIKATDKKHRHAHGMHFTSEADIRQIVVPTITEYWEMRIEVADTPEELQRLHQRMREYRVLDPACGSGNFLYVAYQELKRLEKQLLDKTVEICGLGSLPTDGLVSPNQFYGMDTDLFAVQLARVTMMIARKIAIDTFGLTESALPLDTLDDNIACRDALFTEWPKANAIIGNPPFLGGKKIKSELGQEYANKLHKRFPGVKGQPDFCTFWFRKAADEIDGDSRVGLVGTNSIAQNTSRAASLDYVVERGGHIHSAVSTQLWSGDANVHVSIVNWSKQEFSNPTLDGQPVDFISTSLKNETSVSSAIQLESNKGISFQACELSGKGFIVSEQQAQEWIKQDLKNIQVLKKMVDGKGLINLSLPMDRAISF
jgi:type II restriction/modification system DNA methylase subunit YeeA